MSEMLAWLGNLLSGLLEIALVVSRYISKNGPLYLILKRISSAYGTRDFGSGLILYSRELGSVNLKAPFNL
jgi:hypothetical protein